jgi:hypothetical protein
VTAHKLKPGTVVTNYFEALAATGKPPHGPFDKDRQLLYSAAEDTATLDRYRRAANGSAIATGVSS